MSPKGSKLVPHIKLYLTTAKSRAAEGKKVMVIKQIVAAHFGLTVRQLLMHSRGLRYSWPRAIAVYLSDKYSMLSRYDLALIYRLDRTAVMHAIKKVESFSTLYPEIKMQMEEIQAELNV